MANICCDDVIFYTEGNPEGLWRWMCNGKYLL